MSGWLVVAFPVADPERLHVVPAYRDSDVPAWGHEPSPACSCKPRVTREFDLGGKRREIVVHNGPN